MSQSMDLTEVAHLWDTSEVYTIVATQRGAGRSFQKLLPFKGVEVIKFDFLNPRDVMEYFYECVSLSILWECGGSLAASTISSGVIHKILLHKNVSKPLNLRKGPEEAASIGRKMQRQQPDLVAFLELTSLSEENEDGDFFYIFLDVRHVFKV